MTTEFGFCPNCGTPRVAAEQRFCAGCGATLASAAPVAPVEPIVPPAPAEDAAAAAAEPTAPPAAAQPVAPPPAPPAWSVPPAPPPAPPAWSVATPGAATPASASAGIKVTPQMLAIGGVVLVVIIGAFLFLNMNSSSGGITFTPSTLSCSTPVAFTTTAHLPASVKAGDSVTITLDGKSAGQPTTVSSTGSDVTQQADGSWIVISKTSATEMQSACAAGGSVGGFNVLTAGTHTMQVLDASGKVLAQGSYTVTR